MNVNGGCRLVTGNGTKISSFVPLPSFVRFPIHLHTTFLIHYSHISILLHNTLYLFSSYSSLLPLLPSFLFIMSMLLRRIIRVTPLLQRSLLPLTTTHTRVGEHTHYIHYVQNTLFHHTQYHSYPRVFTSHLRQWFVPYCMCYMYVWLDDCDVWSVCC